MTAIRYVQVNSFASTRQDASRKSERLMTVATDYFVEHGFNGTTIDAIAQAADMGKQAVYTRFTDKERLFDACDTLELCLDAARGMLETITFKRDRLAAAAGDQFLAATDVADFLVKRGMPFREAHGVVAGLVRVAVLGGKRLSELTREELAEQSPLLDDEFYALLADGAWLEGKVSEGGTSLERVREQLLRARQAVG